MFSATVRLGTSENSWNTVATPSGARGARIGKRDRRAVFAGSSPASGWWAPESILISVDLPRAVLADQAVDLARHAGGAKRR